MLPAARIEANVAIAITEKPVKLSQLVTSLLNEASDTAEQARKLGLVYSGYGRWKDPKTNKIAAKTINGQLVKVEDDGAEAGTMAAQQGAEPTQQGVAAVDTADSPDVDEPEPDQPPEPMMQTGLAKLLSAASGDTMKVRKTLAKHYRQGDDKQKAKAKEYLAQLDDHEAREHERMMAGVNKVQQDKLAAIAAKKAKYAALYPKVGDDAPSHPDALKKASNF